jgi:hypothetical protein
MTMMMRMTMMMTMMMRMRMMMTMKMRMVRCARVVPNEVWGSGTGGDDGVRESGFRTVSCAC